MRKRPWLITILAFWKIFTAILALFQIDLLVYMDTFTTISYGFILLGLPVGVGLLRLKNWARVLCILFFYFSLIELFTSETTLSEETSDQFIIIFFCVVYIFWIWYLSSLKRRSLFTSEPAKGKYFSPANARKYQSKAYFGLAKIYQEKKDVVRAFENYRIAAQKGAYLDKNAILFMGENYASKKTTNKEAIDAYLKYIQFISVEDERGKPVYEILESVCRIVETTSSSQREKLIKLNEDVINSNPNVEWAYYYLGIGYVLDKNYTKAIKSLNTSISINKERALSYYWLGMCGIRKLDPQVITIQNEDIVNPLKKYLALESDNKATYVKRSGVNFELGKIYLNSVDDSNLKGELKNKVSNDDLLSNSILHFKEAIEKNENNAEYHYYLGRALILNNDSSGAIKEFTTAIKLDGNQKEYFYYLALEFYSKKKLNEAKSKLHDALKRDNEYKDALKLLARLCFELQDYAETEKICSSLLKKQDDSETRLLLLQSFYHQSKFSSVIPEFEKQKSFTFETPATRETGFCIARSYAIVGSHEKAIELYRKLPEENRVQFYQGYSLRQTGNDKEAMSLFSDLIGKVSEFTTEALIQRGHIYLKQNNLKEAENDYLVALKSKPDCSEIIFPLGMVYFNMGNIKEAKNYFMNTLNIDAIHTQAHFGMGLIYEKEGDIKSARKEYEVAVNNKTPQPQVVKRLGIVYSKLGEHNKAITMLEKVKDTDDNEALLFYLGLSYVSSDWITEGLEVWQKLFVCYPEDERLSINIARSRYLLGLRYLSESNYEKAIIAWESYLEKYSSDEKTRYYLGQLYFRLALNELKKEKIDLNNVAKNLLQATKYNEENLLYRLYYAICQMELGEYTKATKELEKLLNLESDNNRFKYHYALNFLKNGSKDKAMKMFNKILSEKNNDMYSAQAASILANEHILKDEHSKAISILEKVL